MVLIDDVPLRNRVDQLPVVRETHRPGGIQTKIHIIRGDLPGWILHRGASPVDEPLNVPAAQQ